MRTRRLVALSTALLLLLSLAPAALATQPAETPRGQPEDAPFGRGPENRGRSADAPGRLDEPEPAPRLPG